MSAPQEQIRELRQKLTELADDLTSLERLLDVDVSSSLNKIRFITEKVLLKLCRENSVTWGDAEATLERMIGPLVAGGHIPKSIALYVRTIQTNTSPGSHYQESSLSAPHVKIAQSALVEFLLWYYHRTDEATTTARAALAQSASAPMKRRPLFIVAAISGAVLAVVVGVVIWNWPKGSPPPPAETANTPVDLPAAAKKPERDDAAGLQGRWQAVAHEADGKREAMEEGNLDLEFLGQEMKINDSGRVTTARLVVRSETSPKGLDLVVQLDEPGPKKTNRITLSYRFVNDERLEIAFPKGDGFKSSTAAQPKGFDTTAEKIDVLTFERK